MTIINGLLRGGAAGVFTPAMIAGMIAWYNETSSVSLTGALVDQWNDISGNGNHLTATTTLRPTYNATAVNGKAAVQFYADGATLTRMTCADNATMNYTRFSVFAVIQRVVDRSAFETFFTKGDIAGNLREIKLAIQTTSDRFNVGKSSLGTVGSVVSVIPATSLLPVGAPHVLDVNFDESDTLSALTDNAAEATTSSATVFNGTGVIGLGAESTTTEPFQGYIAEIIFYGVSLSSAQRLQVRQYLGTKWGVSI